VSGRDKRGKPLLVPCCQCHRFTKCVENLCRTWASQSQVATDLMTFGLNVYGLLRPIDDDGTRTTRRKHGAEYADCHLRRVNP